VKWAAPAVAVETRAEHSDHAAVLADLDPELHGLPLGIPACVLGEVESTATAIPVGPPVLLAISFFCI
jgi:hypothetical protein